ncbi:hypothetical protein G3I19_10505 [Streptomyces sp. SID10853]|nr:hypothetical protein [Streptomyces sp. SID10853]NDZ78948.1 hypothetical protein [Streptomyces sp. SID10853]
MGSTDTVVERPSMRDSHSSTLPSPADWKTGAMDSDKALPHGVLGTGVV